MKNYQHVQLQDLDDTGFGVQYVQTAGGYTPPHWHEEVELFLFEKGEITCKFENFTFAAKPGSLFIINPYEVHETHFGQDASYLCIHIQPSVMRKFVPNFDQLRFSLVYDPEDEKKAKAYTEFKTQLEEILQQNGENQAAGKLERQARLFFLTALLVKYFSQPLALEESTLRRSDMTRLKPILEQVQLHHDEELPLDDAADAVGLNKEYFCRMFKKNMGISYLQYVYQVRTTAVCRELETSEDPIGEIAERHGFRDPKMLGQYFRELYGCTPSEKRKYFREIHQDAVRKEREED